MKKVAIVYNREMVLLLQLLRLCKEGFVCVFILSPTTPSPHSWRSSLAHVDEYRFYLET